MFATLSVLGSIYLFISVISLALLLYLLRNELPATPPVLGEEASAKPPPSSAASPRPGG